MIKFRIPELLTAPQWDVVAQGFPLFQPLLSLILGGFLSRCGQPSPYVQVPATLATQRWPLGPGDCTETALSAFQKMDLGQRAAGALEDGVLGSGNSSVTLRGRKALCFTLLHCGEGLA